MGENQVDIVGSNVKTELDARGVPSAGDMVAKDGDCFSCLEAREFNESRCCNSCQELKDAYEENGIPYYHILDTAPQCKDSVGCRIHGDVLVSKVGGNIHVALGKSTIRDGKHVHEFNLRDVSEGFNTSHIIHKVRFGAHVPGVSSALEGTSRIVKSGSGMFHYYVKLVPMLYQSRAGTVYTNLYSVTDSAKNVMV